MNGRKNMLKSLMKGWSLTDDGRTYDITELDEEKDNDKVFYKELARGMPSPSMNSRFIEQPDFELQHIYRALEKKCTVTA